MIYEIFFWSAIIIVLYTYFGYGLLLTLLDKIQIFKKIIPRPKHVVESNSVSQKDFFPKVSLIISASGENKKTIREKIENTKNLNYPKDKMEVIFAIAYDSKQQDDETLIEFYSEFMTENFPKKINRFDEELYINFSFIDDSVDLRDELLLEKIENKLSEIEINSGVLNTNSKAILDEYVLEKDESEEFRYSVTKDIERKGKISQVNRTVKKATGDIIVFSDANAMFNENSIRNIVKHFADSQVGCVSGEKKIKKDKSSTSDEGEGFYWKYESYLKKMDSKLWTVVGAAGEIFAVRKIFLDEDIPENAIIEDFVLSMKIAEKGYRVIYEPDAYAEEEPTTNIKSEYIRRRRITAGGFQSMVWLKNLLNPFKFGVLSFQYISHRVLRWAVVPFILPIIFLLNILLFQNSIVYQLIFFFQLTFYVFSLFGLVLELNQKKIKIFNIPFYFSMMNFSAYSGLKRYLLGQQKVIWEQVRT
jgi:cellulose synthase/poly-beta-1,6-N-acetylglucosamine synthase-like glycosyltransferase